MKPGPIAREIVGDPCPLAELDDLRGSRIEMPECMVVGAQGITERAGITSVVLGAGRREAVTEPIQLLRIERVDHEAAFHHGQGSRHRSPQVLKAQGAMGCSRSLGPARPEWTRTA